MRGGLPIGSRLSWVLAWLLAVAAGTAYLLWPGDAMWWVGLLLLSPLVGLAAWRHDQKGGSDYGVSDNGPWSPPS